MTDAARWLAQAFDALAALNPWVIDGRYPGDLDEATGLLASRLVMIADEAITALGHVIDDAIA